MNLKLMKKIMTRKKTTLPPLRNQDWKKFKVDTESVNKLLPNIPTDDITELKKLIYAKIQNLDEKCNQKDR